MTRVNRSSTGFLQHRGSPTAAGKIGLHVTQNAVPTGPWFAALRGGDFSVSTGGSCHGIVNPVLDVQPWLPRSVSESKYGYYEDPKELDIYEKMLHETDPAKQRALMLQYNERVLDEEAHYIHSFWWNRLRALGSSVPRWRIGPGPRCPPTATAGRAPGATTPTRIWGRFGSAPPNAGRVAHARRWRRLKSRPANNPGDKAAVGLMASQLSRRLGAMSGSKEITSFEAPALTAPPFNRSGQNCRTG